MATTVTGKDIKFQGQPSKTKPLAGRKLLWVEDDNFLSDLIAHRLAGEGCVLDHAVNGEDALVKIERGSPDIVLLDIVLPGISGFEVLQKIKQNEKTKKIPIIILSNLGQQSDLNKGKELGADKYLIKATVTLDEIIEEIRKILH